MFQRSHRNLIVLLTLAVMAVFVLGNLIAEPPLPAETTPPRQQLQLPPNLSIPNDADVKTKEGRGAKAIREALKGGSNAGGSADPVLDDVLQIIKQRGSILDGSALGPSSGESIRVSVSERARAAEALLKASRLLEQIEPVRENRGDLVVKMRAEARSLLTP